ncbi:ROK family protein [Cohaesibacter celericrescens]|nr:ROK family protein [Cohaesibacter celericrescens]
MKLSKPKITQLSQSLINAGLIEATGEGHSTSSGGRKPILLSLRKDYPKVVIGVDIGAYNLKVSFGHINGDYTIYKTEKTSSSHFPNVVIRQSANLVLEMMEAHDFKEDDVICVGVSIGGLVNSDKGQVIYSPNFKWEDVALAELLSAEVNLPVYLENCTKAMAIGDSSYDALQESDTVLYVNHGFGVGSAVIRDRKIMPGYCEMGHMTIASSRDVICYCGKSNCLETQASGWAIEWMAMDKLNKDLTAHEVAQLADEGDEAAKSIFRHVGRCLGEAIAASANLLSPDYIVIAGGVSQSNHLYQSSLEKAFRENTMRFIHDRSTLSFSECKSESAIRGILKVALTKSIFSTEIEQLN